jgi:hypothetical protein
MQDSNVVNSVGEGRCSAARDLLRDFAEVGRTHYFNVLVLQKRGHRCVRRQAIGNIWWGILSGSLANSTLANDLLVGRLPGTTEDQGN